MRTGPATAAADRPPGQARPRSPPPRVRNVSSPLSEDQLQRELHLAPWKRLRRLAEIWVREVGSHVVRRAVQIRGVENVERFSAELDPRRGVRKLERLEH